MRKALALGFLLAGLAAATLLFAARPAHASTFTVNSTGDGADASFTDGLCFVGFFDDGSGSLTGECTLRAAIQQANSTAEADTINFNIAGNGPHTISVGGGTDPRTSQKPLPPIGGQVTIDGYTQGDATLANAADDAKENTLKQGNDAVLKIELNGSAIGSSGVDGLSFSSFASGSIVRGLVINGFKGHGITDSADGTVVEGNFIGTDPSGTIERANVSAGILISGGSNNIVGGPRPGARNLISANNAGVMIEASGSPGASGNKVEGNYIGTQKDGTSALGNRFAGVAIFGASNNTIGGTDDDPTDDANPANTIAFNESGGVGLLNQPFSGDTFVPVGNRILSNSIFSNFFGLGIDLNFDGVTLNDPKDRDTGPNALQNFPVITSATTASSTGVTTIKGTLNSRPRKTFTIQFFSNFRDDEGKTLIGETTVRANRRGKASFTFIPSQAVPAGDATSITATATDRDGNTSEFSDPKTVTQL